VDGDDGVLAVVLAAEHLLRLAGVDLGRQLVEAAQRSSSTAPRLAHSTSTARSSAALAERSHEVAVLFEPAAALERLLRLGLVLPEVGLGDALSIFVEFVAGRAASKIAPQIAGALTADG
jgi:hypothetical protein